MTGLTAIARRCMLCGTSITLCMGAVLPRDIVSYLQGRILATEIREICERCQCVGPFDYASFVDPRPLPDLDLSAPTCRLGR